MTNVEALKALYAALGGDPADVADATTIVGVLNVIAAKYEGADDATANAEAIANIAAVAGNITPEPSENNAYFGFYSDPNTQFAAKRSLTTILIPEGYTAIEDQTFRSYTHMVSVTIPNTVESIGDFTFMECASLEKIIINKPAGSITGAPWGAPETTQVIWNG